MTGGDRSPKKRLLHRRKVVGKKLTLKDDNDLKILLKERATVRKKLHDRMTNRLTELWADYTLTEGTGTSAQYDVMVKSYNEDRRDLIVEVKSSSETANLRMAVGQLFSYAYRLNRNQKFDLCVLVPDKPAKDDADWLKSLKIGLIWFSGDKLRTKCNWLSHLI